MKSWTHPDSIAAADVESRMETAWAGRKVYSYTVTDSTNNEIRRLAEQGEPEGTLALAEEQNKGKGRRGRDWMTPAGSAVAMSLLLRPAIEPANASMVTLVMGLAVAAACRELYGVDARIKWPNDVVVDGKKICGILTEMSCGADGVHYVVIGVGINTCVEAFPEELLDKAVSLHKLTGNRPDRAELIACCMKKFEEYYEKFLETENLSQLKEAYNGYLAGKGGMVRVLEPGNEYSGISEGIDERGELQVRREDGTVESVYAGEVSVRGIYGYI